MRTLIDLVEAAAASNTLFHSTDFGAEIFRDGRIHANSTIDLSARAGRASDLRHDAEHHTTHGVCATRSLYFAKQFSPTIFALDVAKLRQQYRIVQRAEAGAYDLADDHGDFRIEAEEFIICPGIDLARFCQGIWINDSLRDDPDHAPLAASPMFRGWFAPV
jgi:hypothetical protein